MENAMDFKGLYEHSKNAPTATQAFLSEVAALTHKSEATVRYWALGRQLPDDLTISVMAEHFGMTPDQLFPNRH